MKVDSSAMTPVVRGYYPFRGQAQVLRLICEYTHVPYYDQFFSPQEWKESRQKEASYSLGKGLPFLKHEDLLLTRRTAMIAYVIELSNHSDLLSKLEEHKILIDSFRSKNGLLEIFLALVCHQRRSQETKGKKPSEGRRQHLKQCYQRKIIRMMDYHEHECMNDSFYLGYLTILYFSMDEVINHLERLLPQETLKFTKLIQIRNRVAALPEIQEYENSGRAIREYSPISYFYKFKEDKTRRILNILNLQFIKISMRRNSFDFN